jgi:hypothetical protein
MSQFRTRQRSIVRDLNERRRGEADIKYRHYVRPHGNRGLHVVKASVDGKEYIVSGPGRTFQPGTVVPTGSNTGTQGEFIVTDPPPGRRGAGNYAPNTITKRGCPVCLKGREYIGITDSGASDIVQAWKYLDGQPGELLDTATLPAELQSGGDERLYWELITPNKIAFVAQDTSNNDRVVIWNIGSTVGAQSHSSFDFKGKLIWTLGSIWYAIEEGDADTEAYRVAAFIGEDHVSLGEIDVSGSQTLSTQDLAIINGQPYIWSDDLDAPVNTAYCAVGDDDFGPAIPEITGGQSFGGYQLNSGETLVANGAVVLANADLRERSLWPAGWGASFFGKLKLSLGTKSEYSLFDFNNQRATRLLIKDYSGIDTNNCLVPTFDVVKPGAYSVQALLPL